MQLVLVVDAENAVDRVGVRVDRAVAAAQTERRGLIVTVTICVVVTGTVTIAAVGADNN